MEQDRSLEGDEMSALLLIDTKRKLEQGQNIFRAKTVKALVGELESLNTRLADANSLIYELSENPSMGLTPKAHDRIQEYWSVTK